MTGTYSETEIAESLLAEMTPAVRGLVESLVARNRELEATVGEHRLVIERLQSIIARQEKEPGEQRELMAALRAEIE